MIDETKKTVIEKKIVDFGRAESRTAFRLIRELEEADVSAKEFVDYFSEKEKSEYEDYMKVSNENLWDEAIPECPNCGTTLEPLIVNTGKRDRIPNENAKLVWECPDCPYNFESVLDLTDYSNMVAETGKIILEK